MILAADSPVYVFIDDTKIIHVIRSHADFAMLENYFLTGQTLATSFLYVSLKCKLGHSHQYSTYTFGDTIIYPTECHMELRILFDSHLKFPLHASYCTKMYYILAKNQLDLARLLF